MKRVKGLEEILQSFCLVHKDRSQAEELGYQHIVHNYGGNLA